jgi:hypothetical protein
MSPKVWVTGLLDPAAAARATSPSSRRGTTPAGSLAQAGMVKGTPALDCPGVAVDRWVDSAAALDLEAFAVLQRR